MTERVTRSMSGKTPRKPVNPGFVETPSRRKSTRKSLFASDLNGTAESTPEPSIKLEEDSSPENTRFTQLSGDHKPQSNGHANGYANGHANGHTNRHADGHAKSKAEAKGFEKHDILGRFEFGGSLGTSAMMLGFPTLMYYMWIGATFYDGKFPTPAADQSSGEFLQHLLHLVWTEAFPHRKAWAIYWVFGVVQMAFYLLLPGVYRKGKPLPHLDGKQLDYYCSALWSLYTTLALVAVLHFTGLFRLYTLLDEFGPIMSVAIISGFGCSILAYVSASVRGATIRMTGYPIYDFFMGSELNPRLFGLLDFKMFFEVRIPWYIILLLSLGTAARQYDQYGYVSGEVIFINIAYWLYANACAKGEHLIITTWDMYYEKLGFMLIFWNMAGVPLSYCHSTLYLANHDPKDYHWPAWFVVSLITTYLFVYYVWDTTNSQKNQFRQEERGGGKVDERRTFPYFKYGRIKNPETITTTSGDTILCDGWYGKARKIHYTCDLFFALSWGLITGFESPFPWFYPTFFACMIVHRAKRDIERCREKYGEAWTEYERRVPYLFIPYVI